MDRKQFLPLLVVAVVELKAKVVMAVVVAAVPDLPQFPPKSAEPDCRVAMAVVAHPIAAAVAVVELVRPVRLRRE